MPEGDDRSHLSDGLYWYAEKLMWGYEGIEKNSDEAYKLFRQAAQLGSTDAAIRLGQLQEWGKGTERGIGAAIKSFQTAAKAGNFFALAYLAKLLSRATHLPEAEAVWARFFASLNKNPEITFPVASRGELLHDYIVTQLRIGLEPTHIATLRRYRLEIVAHHQQLLEHARDEHLDRLEGASSWMKQHL